MERLRQLFFRFKWLLMPHRRRYAYPLQRTKNSHYSG
jgi:hypothetical protein